MLKHSHVFSMSEVKTSSYRQINALKQKTGDRNRPRKVKSTHKYLIARNGAAIIPPLSCIINKIILTEIIHRSHTGIT